MKLIVFFVINFSFVLIRCSRYSIGDGTIPTPACCHSECCCSLCPIGSCSRPPNDVTVLRPCSCDPTPLYTCSPYSKTFYPTLLPGLSPINYPLQPLPQYSNGNNQYPQGLEPYPVVIAPPSPRHPVIIRPFPRPDYMKPCLCGTSVGPNCQQMLPCSPSTSFNGDDNRSWWIWDFSFLETPQGLALTITVIVLILLILCMIIGLIMACVRSRKSTTTTTRDDRDYERQERLNGSSQNQVQQKNKNYRKY